MPKRQICKPIDIVLIMWFEYILNNCLSETKLFYLIGGNNTDSVLTRSFSALVFTEIPKSRVRVQFFARKNCNKSK